MGELFNCISRYVARCNESATQRLSLAAMATIAIVVASGSMVFAQSKASGNLQKPESVYVNVESAYVFAGPSREYYPTGRLQRGVSLEVYHRTADGWLGVRPPEGSFSWVPASHAYLLPGGKSIEVTDQKAVSWIGTELGSAKQYRWQVQLSVGEQLSVLGESSAPNGHEDREALWYRVSPPSGEFRWIEQSAVSSSPPSASQLATTSAAASAKPGQAVVAGGVATGGAGGGVVSSAGYEAPELNAKSTQAEPADRVSPASSQSVLVGSATTVGDRPKATGSSPSRRGKSGSKSNSKSHQNEFDEWVAFEVGDRGMRFPALDKLSGHDKGDGRSSKGSGGRGRRDPLADDPFSLEMFNSKASSAKAAAVPLRNSARGVSSNESSFASATGSGVTDRNWRYPRTMRSNLGRGPYRSGLSSPESLVERSAEGNVGVPGSFVSSAGYDAVSQGASDAGLANWYGYQPQPPVSASGLSSQAISPSEDGAVAELQVALNEMVVQPPSLWDLGTLAQRAQWIIEHGGNAIERGQARLLLDRIEEFQAIAVRSGGGQIGQYSVPGRNPMSFSSVSQGAPVVQASAVAGAGSISQRFEATGWLVKLYTTNPDQPTHAITNDTGDVISYVTGLPGMNLDHHLNQAVGINGLRGYLPQLKAPHIQAQSIVRLK